MNIGRNDPCPCGSGKKYKNCCMNKKDNPIFDIKKLNTMYGKYYEFNKEVLDHANKEDYKNADLGDAILLNLTSNALSLIKAVMLNLYKAETCAINVRNIIESYIMLYMIDQGEITDTHIELFKEQYKIIEYNMYQDKDSMDRLIDKDVIEKNFNEAKEVYLKNGISESKFKRLIKTRVPFLCDDKFSFSEKIAKYCPKLLPPYNYFSIIVHSSPNNEGLQNDYYIGLITIVLVYLELMVSTRDEVINKNFKVWELAIFGEDKKEICPANQFKQLVEQECDVLEDLMKSLKNNLDNEDKIFQSFKELELILKDISSDLIYGLCENTKIKFRVFIEKFALLEKLMFGNNINGELIYNHSLYELINVDKNKNGIELEDNVLNDAYNFYINLYDNGISFVDFKREFVKPLGFLIDNSKKAPTYLQIVKEYIKSIKDYIEMGDIDSEEYILALYLESHAMTHASGYLYFANTGAWSDDYSVINLFDKMLVDLLIRMYACCDENKDRAIVEILDKSIKDLIEVINEKEEMESTIKRINI